MENDMFGGAILAWVKSLRRAGHGMPGQRHGPVQGKLHPRRGAGIELPASLRHRLRRERCHTAHVNLSGEHRVLKTKKAGQSARLIRLNLGRSTSSP